MKPDAICGAAVVAALASPSTADSASTGSHWAVHVESYNQGANPNPSYLDPTTALGSPERFTGEGTAFPSVVSPFSPAFGADELVSIGEGGHLTVRFSTPITDNPANPFGVDLSIFGNAGFIDTDWPNAQFGPSPVLFGVDPMLVEVSADGSTFVSLGTFDNGFLPALGYRDAGAYDGAPGSVPTDFTTPVNPAITPADFAGLDMNDIAPLYAHSGGGTPIDIAGSGLGSIEYVRIVNPVGSGVSVEIDAFARVPTPATALAFLGLSACPRRRR
jgi:hypothetical protein